MISHKHKTIFIHIPKCAGSSVEKAFNVRPRKDEWKIANYNTLMGWCEKNKLHLQHATPQQLIDYGYIDEQVWNEYYKFVIIRNPFERAYSDYKYISLHIGKYGSFIDFLNGSGDYENVMNKSNEISYRGDHLFPQTKFFELNGKMIKYDQVIRFENISDGFNKVISDLNLASDFFSIKLNKSKKVFDHYSKFYTEKRRLLVEKKYTGDLEWFNYEFEDKKTFTDKLRLLVPVKFYIKAYAKFK